METSRRRIVVVSLSGALATRLTLAEPTWDVEHVADCTDVRWVDGFDGAVVDATSDLTVERAGVAALAERCQQIVVLGQVHDIPEGVVLLAPPFELRDLVEALGGEVPPDVVELEPAAPRPRRFRRAGRVREPDRVTEATTTSHGGNGNVTTGNVTNGNGGNGNGAGRSTQQVTEVRVAAAPGVPASSPLLDEAPLRPRHEPPAPLPARPMSAQRFGERVERALLAMDEVHSLVAEVPTLADLEAIGAAIVEEIRDEVRASTVCVLGRASDGFAVIDGAGLEEAEAHAVVPASHPFLRALADRRHAAHFERRGGEAIVAGIPGATTPFIAVAPMRRDGTMIGLLLVGADTIEGSVTKVLDRVANEAQAALALAVAIRRLTGRA